MIQIGLLKLVWKVLIFVEVNLSFAFLGIRRTFEIQTCQDTVDWIKMFPRGVYTFFDEDNGIWRGRHVPPLYNVNQGLGELLWQVMGRSPWKIAQISADSGVRLTYGEIRWRSIRVAQNLEAMGFQAGDLISIIAKNNEKLASVVFGCFMLAAPINTLDPRFQSDDFAHMFKLVKPKAVICEGDLVDTVKEAFELASIEPQLIVFGPRINGYARVDDLLVETGSEVHYVPTHVADPESTLAIIICSSGTTGKSKGVCLSHSICIANTSVLWACSESDRVLSFSSLYWISGLGTLLTGTMAGATRIVTTNTYSPAIAIDLIEQYRVTAMFVPPSSALDILNDSTIGMADFSSLRMVLCGGGQVPAELKRSFEMYLPKGRFAVGYGLSELGGAGCSTAVAYKDNCVGSLGNNFQGKIVDDEGNLVPFDTEGELLIKGPYVFMEYYGDPEATAEMLDQDGWLHTGDIARVDEDGMFFIVDRKKDIIKYSGFQISPSEIESVIFAIPGVVAVCVTGIPIPGHDLPVALVKKVPESEVTEEIIINTVADKLIDFKHLRGGVFFVDSFPMTPSGKILRRKCRDMAIEMFNDGNNNTA
ncbi:uncharacterized protein LOC129754504 [Uranotaenia lowii]|uniref:uncharacterized protein LOC129754504 n=1 Tax=Uranotaenia lowii TaxID=190385 RepID=UPI002478DB73|nr:uncharacterized protein LOC129754504 [Uranotaenia lowii]